MTKMNVEVSIILPTYNRAHLIKRAVNSVLNQSYKDFEMIIVDDNSTDNTIEIINSINDERINVIRHDTNKGPSAARNNGIRISRGEFIAFLDSDDEWLAKNLEKQVSVFKNADSIVGMVYVGMLNINGEQKKYIPPPHVTRREGNLYSDLLTDPTIVYPSTTTIRKRCLLEVGMFDEHFRAGEDWDLWIRLAKHYHFKYIDELLVINYAVSDSITHKENYRLSQSYKMILEKHYEEIAEDKKTLASYYIVMGHALSSENELKKGRQYFIRAAKVNPLNILSIPLVVASCLGPRGYTAIIAIFNMIRGFRYPDKRYQVEG